MVYNWDDLQENRFEVVEWGDNVRRTRRERVLGNIMSPEDRKKRLITSAVVVISTIVALGIAVTVALTLVGPMPEPADGGGNPVIKNVVCTKSNRSIKLKWPQIYKHLNFISRYSLCLVLGIMHIYTINAII